MSADAPDWIEWTGGDCPIDPETRVFVRLRNFRDMDVVVKAKSLDWHHNRPGRYPGNGDIIAYRVAAPKNAEA